MWVIVLKDVMIVEVIERKIVRYQMRLKNYIPYLLEMIGRIVIRKAGM